MFRTLLFCIADFIRRTSAALQSAASSYPTSFIFSLASHSLFTFLQMYILPFIAALLLPATYVDGTWCASGIFAFVKIHLKTRTHVDIFAPLMVWPLSRKLSSNRNTIILCVCQAPHSTATKLQLGRTAGSSQSRITVLLCIQWIFYGLEATYKSWH